MLFFEVMLEENILAETFAAHKSPAVCFKFQRTSFLVKDQGSVENPLQFFFMITKKEKKNSWN